MRTSWHISLFVVLMQILSGCIDPEVLVEEPEYIVRAEMLTDDTKTSVTDYGFFTWTEGDKIWLHTSRGGVEATLYSGAGTDKATFSHGAYFGQMSGKAVYPYNEGHSISDDELTVVLPSEYDLGSLTYDTNALLYAYTSNNVLKFSHMAGVMRFSLKGVPEGASQFKLTLDKKINGKFKADISEDKPLVSAVVTSDDSEKTIAVNFDALTQCSDLLLYFPVPIGIYNSISLEINSADGTLWSYSNIVTNTIRHKQLLLMPDVTVSHGMYTDLSVDGTANSYIVSQSGGYKFIPTKGNSLQSVGSIASAEVLWESFGTDMIPQAGSLVKNVTYQDGVITFETPSEYKEGNAVIAAKDASGTILWSWHIWLTDQPQGQEYYNNAGTMMDRNLGATSATPGEVGTLGLLYQWGRKDPFLGSSSISESVEAMSTITWPSVVTSNSSIGTIEYATANPTTYILSNSKNLDWYYTGSDSSDNTRWTTLNRKKSIYDPCPVGWRVPDGGDDAVWSDALGTLSSSVTDAYDSGNYGIDFSEDFGEDNIWYPDAGYRRSDEGYIYNVGLGDGNYWTASSYSSYTSYVFAFTGYGNVYLQGSSFRADGNSVRCIREEYPVSPSYQEVEYIDEYGVNHGMGVYIAGLYWAPVNCGYHETDYPYGKLYQWGRKYGQGYSGNLYDGNGNYTQYSDAETTALIWATTTLSVGQSKYVQHYFYKNDLYPYDWLEYQDDQIWNSGSEDEPVKAEFDPCPYGWRVPTYGEFYDLIQNSAWGQNNEGQNGSWLSGANAYSLDAPQVFLPATGQRNYSTGNADNRGKSGYYWISSTESNNYDIRCFILSESGPNLANTKRRADGLAVRCVMDW